MVSLKRLNFLRYLKPTNPNSDLLKLFIYSCGGRVWLPDLVRFCRENNLQYTNGEGESKKFIGELRRDGVIVEINNSSIICSIPNEFKMTDERKRIYRELVEDSKKYKI